MSVGASLLGSSSKLLYIVSQVPKATSKKKHKCINTFQISASAILVTYPKVIFKGLVKQNPFNERNDKDMLQRVGL